jgi:hypothetical protein
LLELRARLAIAVADEVQLARVCRGAGQAMSTATLPRAMAMVTLQRAMAMGTLPMAPLRRWQRHHLRGFEASEDAWGCRHGMNAPCAR